MTRKKEEGNNLISMPDPCCCKEFDSILNCPDRVLNFSQDSLPNLCPWSSEWFTGDHVTHRSKQ